MLTPEQRAALAVKDEAIDGAVRALLASGDLDAIRAAHPEPPKGWPESEAWFRRAHADHFDDGYENDDEPRFYQEGEHA